LWFPAMDRVKFNSFYKNHTSFAINLWFPEMTCASLKVRLCKVMTGSLG
jgi:hypothetical protein